jgi:hypothetical protein
MKEPHRHTAPQWRAQIDNGTRPRPEFKTVEQEVLLRPGKNDASYNKVPTHVGMEVIQREEDHAIDAAISTIEAQPSSLDIAKQRYAEDSIVLEEQERLAQDFELQNMYRALIEQGDVSELKKKSKAQLDLLLRIHWSDIPFWNIKKKRELEKKLQKFQDFIASLRVVRSDNKDIPVYKSPSQTGNVYSYGPYDIMSRSEEFVYASFDTIGHGMSKGTLVRELDMDSAGSAQIVMNDIANVAPRAAREQQAYMKKYINNLFDFDTGKEILAAYLAYVFDTPEQASDLLSRAGGRPDVAQLWDSTSTTDILTYQDTTPVNSQEEFNEKNEKSKALTQKFIFRMKEILASTGIEPPLSLEVRIRDSVGQKNI